MSVKWHTLLSSVMKTCNGRPTSPTWYVNRLFVQSIHTAYAAHLFITWQPSWLSDYLSCYHRLCSNNPYVTK